VPRIYAGVLGFLAMLVAIARGFVHGSQPDAIIGSACVCLWVFAAIGYLAGWIAQTTIEASVSTRVQQELTAQAAAEPGSNGAGGNQSGA